MFSGDEDYRTHLRLLQHQSFQNGLALLGYCLMPNHVHLVAVPAHAESLARTLGSTHSQPVRAGLAANAWDWKWSSAHANADEGADDFMLDRRWFDSLGGWDHASWRECLASESDESEVDSLRHATIRGEPFGPPECVEELERQSGRRLRVLSRGRPRKEREERCAQGMLFSQK